MFEENKKSSPGSKGPYNIEFNFKFRVVQRFSFLNFQILSIPLPMYCAPFCSLPLSSTLRLLSCEAVLEPQQRCRSRNPFWRSPERFWCLHNGEMLKMLAYQVGKPVEQVCPFMYGLTMKKFGEILNPKCSGWNCFRVPMTRPDTCALYDGIFNREGNIRNPLHPLIIRLLLCIMSHFLNLPCQGDTTPKRRSNVDDMFTGGGVVCFDLFNSGRSCRGGKRGGRRGQGDRGVGDDLCDGFEDALKELYDKASGRSGNFLGLDNDGYGDGDGNGDGDGDGDGDDDGDGNDGKDGDNGDDSFGANDGRMSTSDRKSIKAISNLYNKVVGKKKRTDDKLGKGEGEDDEDEDEEDSGAAKSKPKPRRKKKIKTSERRYMGKMIPVLMHEPFNQSKPWTWVRRHPLQDRVLEGKEIGRSKVHRYKRETLEKQMARAQQRYSAHSAYSVAEHKSVLETAMFGQGQHKKKHPGMARPYDYKKLRETESVEPQPELTRKQRLQQMKLSAKLDNRHSS